MLLLGMLLSLVFESLIISTNFLDRVSLRIINIVDISLIGPCTYMHLWFRPLLIVLKVILYRLFFVFVFRLMNVGGVGLVLMQNRHFRILGKRLQILWLLRPIVISVLISKIQIILAILIIDLDSGVTFNFDS
jgi:hypothetical protein